MLEQTHTVANAVSDRQLLVYLFYMVILTPFKIKIICIYSLLEVYQ